MDKNEQRLEALEIKMMDLEQAVTDLNDVIIRQYQIIDSLQAAQKKLTDQVEGLHTGGDRSEDEPPPHY